MNFVYSHPWHHGLHYYKQGIYERCFQVFLGYPFLLNNHLITQLKNDCIIFLKFTSKAFLLIVCQEEPQFEIFLCSLSYRQNNNVAFMKRSMHHMAQYTYFTQKNVYLVNQKFENIANVPKSSRTFNTLEFQTTARFATLFGVIYHFILTFSKIAFFLHYFFLLSSSCILIQCN